MSNDGSKVGLESFAESVNGIHKPRVMISESCRPDCRELARVAGEAALLCMMYPGKMVDVVCQGPKWFGKCNAELVATAKFMTADGESWFFPEFIVDAVTNMTTFEVAITALQGVQDGTMRMVPLSDLRL